MTEHFGMKPSVSLEPLCWEKDLAALYRYMTTEEQYLFSTKVLHLSPQRFEEWLAAKLDSDFHDFYMVRGTDGTTVGYVHNYGFSTVNRHCKLVTYIVPEQRQYGLGAQATVLFMDNLFRRYPLEKLYSTVYAYNEESLQCNRRAGFVYEGTLKDFRYYDGKHWPLAYFSITREQFYHRFGRFL
ncbi:MAG: GNAT family N-acetyltransferase [Eubacterium sp.]|nr:GNAT family N-acetyltransferase [Eubacterium sp.]